MKTRNKIGAVTIALALGMGGAVVTALPASAHTPTASATCSVLTVNAKSYETRPATAEIPGELISAAIPEQPVVELTPVIPATPGQPFIAAIPEVPEISHVEYKFVHKHDWFHLNPKWKSDPNWNAESNGNSTGWILVGERTIVTQAFVAGTPGQAYIAPTPEIPATFSEYVPAQDAVYGDPTPAQPADSTPNTVVVTIDGDVVEDAEFGTSFSGSYTFDNKHVAHDWTVVITAWNDVDGANGWTKTLSGTTTPCYDASLRPSMSHTVDCGTVTMTFNNPTKFAFAFDYRVDDAAATNDYGTGPVYSIVNVAKNGGVETRTVTFDEDSGDHTVAYRLNLGAEQDYYLPWVTVDVDSDCADNPVTALPPTFVDVCGIDNDEVNVPDNTDQVEYTTDDQRVDGIGTVTVTATALEGFMFDLGEGETARTLTWGGVFTDEDCPVEVVPPTEEGETVTPVADKLAFTGPTDAQQETMGTIFLFAWILSGLGIIAASIGFGSWLLNRRRNAAEITE